MSYLAFHLVFILPPILLMAATLRGRLREIHPRAGLFLAAMALIALLYTTPWDNYLIWRGVWSYGADRVVGTIGYVPVEEYLFFLFQPVLTGLWLFLVLRRRGQPAFDEARPEQAARHRVRAVGALFYLLLSALGVLLLGEAWGTYLGLILAWACPVLMLQWAYAGGAIWMRRRAFFAGVAVPTLYLWVADALAIRWGIWGISEELTTGLALFGLPLEEAVFFLITNLLVVQGLMLFLFPPVRSSVVGNQSSVDNQSGSGMRLPASRSQ